MEELEKKLGSELYFKVKVKLGDLKLLIDDGKLIPKHRFDCINLSLKDHKEQVQDLRAKIALLENSLKNEKELESKIATLEREIIILTELSKSKAKNIQTILPLLQIDNLFGGELIHGIQKQIRLLKKTDSYLFIDGNELYRIVPYRRKEKME